MKLCDTWNPASSYRTTRRVVADSAGPAASASPGAEIPGASAPRTAAPAAPRTCASGEPADERSHALKVARKLADKYQKNMLEPWQKFMIDFKAKQKESNEMNRPVEIVGGPYDGLIVPVPLSDSTVSLLAPCAEYTAVHLVTDEHAVYTHAEPVRTTT